MRNNTRKDQNEGCGCLCEYVWWKERERMKATVRGCMF